MSQFGITPVDASIDWDALTRYAAEVRGRAHAPYSKFGVGAAALVDDGRVVLGCNVENASHGLGLCAECGVVSALHATGGGRLLALVCLGPDDTVLLPCGRCRQLLWEHGGPACEVLTPEGVVTMAELLPQPFDADDLQP